MYEHIHTYVHKCMYKHTDKFHAEIKRSMQDYKLITAIDGHTHTLT